MPGAYTTYSSTLINGQMVPVYAASGMRPAAAFAPQYGGRGAPPPTLPSGVTGTGNPVGTGATSAQAVNAAAAAPLNMQVSPVVWLIVFLAVGLIGLRYVHWRG